MNKNELAELIKKQVINDNDVIRVISKVKNLLIHYELSWERITGIEIKLNPYIDTYNIILRIDDMCGFGFTLKLKEEL